MAFVSLVLYMRRIQRLLVVFLVIGLSFIASTTFPRHLIFLLDCH